MDIGAGLQEHNDGLLVAPVAGVHERCPAVLVDGVYVTAGLEEHAHDVGVAALRRVMQRGALALVAYRNVRVVLEQDLDHFVVAVRARDQ